MRQWFKENKECIRRTARTFMQAAVGFFITALASGEYNISEWKTWILTLCASAVSAGMSAAMNRKKGEKYEKTTRHTD